MPELNSIAIKKWSKNYSGAAPVIDFSNGVRIRDIAVDTSSTPNKIWVCRDNTIGNPVWELETFPLKQTLADNTSGYIEVGDITQHSQIIVSYTLKGGSYNQEGLIRISHDNIDSDSDHEFSGKNEVENLEIYTQVTDNKIYLYFDITSGVGTSLSLVYNIISQLPI